MDFQIVPIKSDHIDKVVDVHIRAFPDFFLTFLGPRFLREFYGSFLQDPTGVGFVAEDAQTSDILGAVVGPVTPRGYFKRLLKRRWWAFCRAAAGAVLRRPATAKRLFRAVFYRGEAPPGPPRALLSSIAVAPEAQRRGVGRALVGRWVEEVKRRRAAGCYLTTDAHNNDKVNAFYQGLGWKVESTYTTPEGRCMNRYVLDLSADTQENPR
ncbi:MAG TPA: N-acetyltransferase [Phycisphaerales bacterium]|nr:N-acetyltransferase [Phycisphaerales bacterium]